MRRLTLAAAALAGFGALAPAGAEPVRPDLTRVYPGEAYAQYRYRHGYGRPYYPARPHYYVRRRDNGAAVAAGVAGLAAGALIAGAIANQAHAAPPRAPATVDPQLAAWCARRYRSFDPMTGTYVSYTGERLACTY